MHRRCICVVILDSNLSDFLNAPSLFADTSLCTVLFQASTKKGIKRPLSGVETCG